MSGRTGPDAAPWTIHVDSDAAIVAARRQGRHLAHGLGFGAAQVATVVTVITELTRNILLYAGEGDLTLTTIGAGRRPGLEITASDHGPGIANLTEALADGFSTSGRLGLGLPGVKRLMDEFDITSTPGCLTTVTTRTWRK